MTAEEIRAALAGRVVPAVPVPFTSNSQLDRESHSQYIAWMGKQSIGAVAVWAHTGRGLHLSPDQRGEVIEAWTAADAHPVIAGVGVPHDHRLPSDPRARTDAVIEATLEMIQEARSGGAVAVLAHPPSALRDLADLPGRVRAYHEAISDRGLPFIAFYLYDAAGGIAYEPDTLDSVLALPGAVGVKLATLDSIITVQDICARVAARPDVLVITGEDRFLGYSLTLGAQSALIGMGAALTDVFVGLLDAHVEGVSERFALLSGAVDRYAAATFTDPMEGYVQRMLWALADDDVLPIDAHDPFAPPLSSLERARVRDVVRRLREFA